MTAPVPLVERLAEALGWHRAVVSGDDDGWHVVCTCGHDELGSDTAAHVARALLPVVEQAVAEGRGEALREAAKEAEERGDIGKDGGCEAWTWLRIRADRIGGAE